MGAFMIRFKKCIELAAKTDETNEYDVSFKVDVNGESWDAYSASIANRDILLFTNKGTCTFLVDTYGNKNTCELFDWSEE